MRHLSLTILISLLLFCSCNQFPPEVQNALHKANDNRRELESVLGHYSEAPSDSLKLRAACFLISNMPHHRSFATEPYTAYCHALDSLYAIDLSGDEYNTETHKILQRFTPQLKLQEDLHFITADYLIQNIDYSFAQWQNSPYLQHLNFEEFCEYILPYKCFEGQPLDDWKRRWCNPGCELQGIAQIDEYKYNARRAVEAANKDLQDSCKLITFGGPYQIEIIDIFDLPTLMHRPYGTCKEMAQLILLNTRSKALPVSFDFSPAWPDRAFAHHWNNVFATTRRNVDFEGLGMPGIPRYMDNLLGKVFRLTYAPHPLLLEATEKNLDIPKSLQLFSKDVTPEYARTTDISIPLFIDEHTDFAYLATFDNAQWIPTDIGRVKQKKAVFCNVPVGILYIAGTYQNGRFSPASDPFIVDTRARITPLRPTNNTQSLRLTRKFPAFGHIHWINENLRMGRIEAADTPNFNHADSILGFPEWNLLAGEELIQDTIPHRYWRLLSSTSHPTDFAEIYFYKRGTGKRLTGKIIHPNAPIRDSVRDTPKFICDNNPLTYFTVENTDRPRWVGFDFGQPVSMEKVAYIRRGDGNDICPGDVYELYYWKNNRWHLHNRQKADNVYLDFDMVPAGSLYYIRDSTRGTQNRTFIFENGKVIWH